MTDVGRRLLRIFGVLFGKRVGNFTERAGESIAGEFDASPEMRLLAETLIIRGLRPLNGSRCFVGRPGAGPPAGCGQALTVSNFAGITISRFSKSSE